jgi:cysteine synthase
VEGSSQRDRAVRLPKVRVYVSLFYGGLSKLFRSPSDVGIGQGRITDNLATFVNDLSGSFHIPDAKSIAMVYELLDTEGLYMGASSALNVVAAVELAGTLGRGWWHYCLFVLDG